MLKIRRPRNRHGNMGIPIHGKKGLYTATEPRFFRAQIISRRGSDYIKYTVILFHEYEFQRYEPSQLWGMKDNANIVLYNILKQIHHRVVNNLTSFTLTVVGQSLWPWVNIQVYVNNTFRNTCYHGIRLSNLSHYVFMIQNGILFIQIGNIKINSHIQWIMIINLSAPGDLDSI